MSEETQVDDAAARKEPPAFNPKAKYFEVMGDSPARFKQNGEYYDGKGNWLSAEEAAKPSPGGSFMSQVEASVERRMLEERSRAPLGFNDPFNTKTNSPEQVAQAKAERAERVQLAGMDEDQDREEFLRERRKEAEEQLDARREALSQFNFRQVQKMVTDLGIEPQRGPGSRKRNIEILLANTE